MVEKKDGCDSCLRRQSHVIVANIRGDDRRNSHSSRLGRPAIGIFNLSWRFIETRSENAGFNTRGKKTVRFRGLNSNISPFGANFHTGILPGFILILILPIVLSCLSWRIASLLTPMWEIPRGHQLSSDCLAATADSQERYEISLRRVESERLSGGGRPKICSTNSDMLKYTYLSISFSFSF